MVTDVTKFHSSVPTEFYRWAPMDEKRLEFAKKTIAKGASDIELQEFTTLCDNLHLSPFTRPAQIWFIKRRERKPDGEWGDTFSVQVGIAGYRAIAARTGLYLGSTQPEWCGPDGIWRDVWLYEDKPMAARVGVSIRGARLPTYRVALWREFAQFHTLKNEKVLNSLWEKYPTYMLAKCAEKAALTAAFPEETAGAQRYFDAGDGPRIEVLDEIMDRLSAPSQPRIRAARAADLYPDEPYDVTAQPMRADEPNEDETRPPTPQPSADDKAAMAAFWKLEREMKAAKTWTDAETLGHFAPAPREWAAAHGGWAEALAVLRDLKELSGSSSAPSPEAAKQEPGTGCPGCGDTAAWRGSFCMACGFNAGDGLPPGELPGMPSPQPAASRRGSH